jgi:antitoxin component HigA of HigAB toxin-antitoxin module
MMKLSTYDKYMEDPERRRILEQERVMVDATELVCNAMDFRRIKRSELAHKMGRSKAYVTQILRGNQNLTLRTLADVFHAMNCRLVMVAATEAGWIFSRHWNMTQQVPSSVVPTEGVSVEEQWGVAA